MEGFYITRIIIICSTVKPILTDDDDDDDGGHALLPPPGLKKIKTLFFTTCYIKVEIQLNGITYRYQLFCSLKIFGRACYVMEITIRTTQCPCALNYVLLLDYIMCIYMYMTVRGLNAKWL